MTMRRVHDVGGLEAGPIDRSDPPLAAWEERFSVVLGFLSARSGGVITLDEFRRAVEDLGAEEYRSLRWHERAAAAVANLLLQRGVVTVEEIRRKQGEIMARLAGRTGR